MTSRARWMVAIAAVVMSVAYVLPLWRVDLIAPQYPEGLGMFIKINGVDGLKPNDLNNINNLNHYIGMKAIEPDAIPELKWMPWILAGLIAGGLAVAAMGKRAALHVYAGALALILTAGLYDYWRWGYDYGHDLDQEVAIIKIPGMTYQPPLIGTKKLLNFKAKSWPSGGGVALTFGALLVGLAIVDSRRRRRPEGEATGLGSTAPISAALLLMLTLGACSARAPRDIVLGEDQCGYCRMEITDARFGAQVITTTGRHLVFDAPECLGGFLAGTDASTLASVWVLDAERPGTWVEVNDAGFLIDASIRGPMGRVVAFASPQAASAARATLGGTPVSWEAIRSDSAGIRAHGH
jgi:copper chaperone NosL